LLGYDKVMSPPEGSTEAVVNESVTNTPPLPTTRSLLAIVRVTFLTCPPALTIEFGCTVQVISLGEAGAATTGESAGSAGDVADGKDVKAGTSVLSEGESAGDAGDIADSGGETEVSELYSEGVSSSSRCL
jgi:hypothetical protein